ncbi:MAG: hypothetical protein C5B49_01105 [Bdellovibrio sp.]|nr:MAG: hypothetical protein C5B49_01105 [Bdellovibrio sp.]
MPLQRSVTRRGFAAHAVRASLFCGAKDSRLLFRQKRGEFFWAFDRHNLYPVFGKNVPPFIKKLFF